MPLSAATPEPVEIDQVFNTFDDPTRAAIQVNLTEFGNALAGRGAGPERRHRRPRARWSSASSR